jgi:putative tryptophan/tyrosine transport system substrate-binding protein
MVMLADSGTTSPRHLEELREAGHARGVELSVFAIAKPEEVVPVIDKIKASGAAALNVLASPLFGAYPNCRIVTERAAALRLPAGAHRRPPAPGRGVRSY